LSFDESYPARYGSGGLLASGGLRASDVTHVLIDLLRTTAVSTRVKPNHDTTGRWEAGCVAGVVSIPRRLEVLDLDGGFSRVWDERFKPAARRAVRKAERSGLVVERDSSMRLIAPFYDLYLEWTNQRARESGVPARVAAWLARRREPLRKLQAVAAMVGDACRIWVARYDDCPVAAIITLVYRNHAIYWQGYSSKALRDRCEPTTFCSGWQSRMPARPVVAGTAWASQEAYGRSCGSNRHSGRPLVAP
jgi:Acetyltransferase (GNAT) domain